MFTQTKDHEIIRRIENKAQNSSIFTEKGIYIFTLALILENESSQATPNNGDSPNDVKDFLLAEKIALY